MKSFLSRKKKSTRSGSTVGIGESQAQDSEERLEDVDTVDADAADDTEPATSGRYGLKILCKPKEQKPELPSHPPSLCPLPLPLAHPQPHPFPFALLCTDAHSARSFLLQRPRIMRHFVAVLVVEDDLDECNDLLAWDSFALFASSHVASILFPVARIPVHQCCSVSRPGARRCRPPRCWLTRS